MAEEESEEKEYRWETGYEKTWYVQTKNFLCLTLIFFFLRYINENFILYIINIFLIQGSNQGG